jgi:hypothetical protein
VQAPKVLLLLMVMMLRAASVEGALWVVMASPQAAWQRMKQSLIRLIPTHWTVWTWTSTQQVCFAGAGAGAGAVLVKC